jgi:hypothetical protein
MTMTARTLFKAASLLPLLGLAACAGSQRFVGPAPGGPVYSQPALQPAPPITSAPVTSEPLPPPGGYPIASAPSGPGALPPPGDPFFDPDAGAPQPAPPAAPAQPPTLRGGGGDVQTLGSGQARAPVSSRDGVIGGWTAREATGGSCRVQLSSASTLDLYRASASGCSNRDLQTVNAWDYRNGEVYLYQQGGTVVARLRAESGGALSGAVTKSGAALTLSR